ncbi:MAG: hypothetical protein A2W31_16490 [Planctomycetes bacterium RBG_16_64_10]|nr:MAG: hypothetical protein A2W31_16490 [Planctomycetes bacterium RBG_16_64_10]
MQRKSWLVFLLALAGVGWFFFGHFQLEGLDQVVVRRRSSDAVGRHATSALKGERDGRVIRIASFNIQVFGEGKARKPHVMEILAEIVRRFDIVAIQEIRSASEQLLPEFVEQINAAGHQYDFVVGARQGRTSSKEQYAFVFDSATVQVDRFACYNVGDPHDLLHRPPLVGLFRVRGAVPEQAFTFLLINVHTDPDEVEAELDTLADVLREVRRASGGEDDVMLVGDFNANDQQLGALGAIPGIRCAISGVATNTRGTKQYDNLLFDGRATTEYTGRAGVLDVMREFNLTTQQTLEISDHLPVWAEFGAYEHGLGGPVAARPATTNAAR